MAAPTIVGTPYAEVYASTTGGGLTKTYSSYNHPSGDLFVMVSSQYAPSGITSCTWNGTSMSTVGSASNDAYSGRKVKLFYLASAATGTHDIVITMGEDSYVGFSVFSCDALDGTTPYGTFATENHNTTTAMEVTVAGTADALMVAWHGGYDVSTTTTAGSGCTELTDATNTNHTLQTETKAGDTSVVLAATLASANVGGISAGLALYAPAAGGGSIPIFKHYYDQRSR